MLHVVMILDSSGVLIDSYKLSSVSVNMKDDALLGSFVAALLQFGEEVFARPQRLDMNGYALNFYKLWINKNEYYVVALTDSKDNVVATKRLILDIISTIRDDIENFIVEGIVLTDAGAREKIRSKVEKIAKKYYRSLAKFRSGGFPSILLGTFSGSIAYVLSSIIFFTLIALAFGITETGTIESRLYLTIPIFLTGLSVGLISGIIAGRANEGAISGYLGYTIPTIIFFFTSWIVSWGFSLALTVLIFNMIGIATLSASIGYIFGLWEDSRKLSGA